MTLHLITANQTIRQDHMVPKVDDVNEQLSRPVNRKVVMYCVAGVATILTEQPFQKDVAAGFNGVVRSNVASANVL